MLCTGKLGNAHEVLRAGGRFVDSLVGAIIMHRAIEGQGLREAEDFGGTPLPY